MIENLELKLKGNIPVTREDLIELVSSWGRKRYVFTRDKINIERCEPKEKYPLENLDVSQIKNLSYIFAYSMYNGDLSKWDVSNTKSINNMFMYSEFNNDSLKNWLHTSKHSFGISFLDSKNSYNKQLLYFTKLASICKQIVFNFYFYLVSNIKYMNHVFANSSFNGKIKNWDVSNVETMQHMFYESNFNRNISIWNISNCLNMDSMFDYTEYTKDLSNWIFNENVYKNWIIENNTYKKMDIEEIHKINEEIYHKEKEKNYDLNEILPNNNNENLLNINDSFEIFKKQLKGFSSDSIISGKNLYIENDKIYLKLFEHKTENRFYNEFVQYKKENLSNFLNRNVIYHGSKSVFLGMELEFEIKHNEKIDNNIKTLNGEILYNDQLETYDFYSKDSIIIEVIRQLTLNNKIGDFILNNNKLYLNDELLLTINYLKKSSYESNRSGTNTTYDSFNYNIVLNKELYSILNDIKEEYKKEHNGYNLEYSSLGSENTNWVIKDLDLNDYKKFNDWEENLSNIELNLENNDFNR